MKCWICGVEDAQTREHLAKASDIKSFFGKPSRAKPFYFHTSDRTGRLRKRTVRIGSVKSDTLKFAHRICETCNSKRTQPYDYAWEHASAQLRAALPRLRQAGSFRAEWLFPYDTRRHMRRLHLYFTKLFGCIAVEGNIPVDVAALAKALIDGRPHPHIHLAFGFLNLHVAAIGGSDVHADLLPDGRVVFASWLYHVGDLAVNVMYALPNEQRQGLVHSWQPRGGSKRLWLKSFNG